MIRKNLTAAAVALAALATSSVTAVGAPEQDALRAFLDSDIRSWSQDPVLVDAIQAQNARTSGLGDADILALDESWQAEIGATQRPTIQSVLSNPAADFLTGIVEKSGGAITEIFIMDAKGLNVAASAITSDYWQGDEAKHQQTFGVGPDAVHIGEIEFDESSQRYQSQISITITDPDTGSAIGAVTVGIDAESVM